MINRTRVPRKGGLGVDDFVPDQRAGLEKILLVL